MSTSSAEKLDPKALSPEQLARVLSAAGYPQASVEMIRADIDAGAPVNPDGTINLVHYAAWLVKQTGGRRREEDCENRNRQYAPPDKPMSSQPYRLQPHASSLS